MLPSYLLWANLTAVPIPLVLLVGLILAIVRRSQHPKVSALVATGLSIMLVVSVASSIGNRYIPQYMMAHDMRVDSLQKVLIGMGIAHSVLTAVGLSFVMAALFARRRAE